MGATQQSGQNDQFDDLILDPDSAEGGEELNQGNQGYDDPKDGESKDEDKDNKEELDSFDNLKDSQLNNLEEKDDKDEEEKDDKDGDKEKDLEAPKKDDTSQEEKKEDESKGNEEDLKTLKLFRDGKKYEIPQDATVRVKVAGKNEKVTISELRDGYAGKQAWDKKFSGLTQREQDFEQKSQSFRQKEETLNTKLGEVVQGVKSAMETGENPMGAVNKLVDMMNVDSYDFNKALFESMQEELNGLNQMDETERRAYWLEKRTNHLQQKHESLEKSTQQARTQAERTANVDKLREAHGVSEEDFVSAYEQLGQHVENPSSEQVVKYAASLPYVEQAEELMTPYEDQLSDDEMDEMMGRVAHTLRHNKSITKEDVVSYLAETFEAEDAINDLNSKADRMEAGRKNLSDGHGAKAVDQRNLYANPSMESFDDFDV